jgi:hypothetical protein
MSDEDKSPVLSTKEFEAASAELASKQVEGTMYGQEAVTTATIETPLVGAVIEERVKNTNVKATELVYALRSIEHGIRKNYADPDRITVPVSANAVIHQDFRRKVLIPDHVMFPRPAIVNGKELQVGSVKIAPIVDRDGKLWKAGYELPIFAAADADGSPMRDSNGAYVVIDPQTGAIRQRVRGSDPRPSRSRWLLRWNRVVAWFKSFRFDFRFIKRRP